MLHVQEMQRRTLDSLLEAVESQWQDNGIGSHIMSAVREGARPDILRTMVNDTEFIDGLIQDLEHLRRLHYVRVHIPGRPRRRRFVQMTVEGDIGECAICQEDFKVGETIIPLPCNETHPHVFHKQCIEPWVVSNNTCPVCRGKI